MRPFLTAAFAVLACVPAAIFADEPAASELKTNREKVSYAIGRNIGTQFQQQELDVDPRIVAAGIASILNGTESLLTDDQMQAAFEAFREEMKQAQAEKAKQNKVEATKFLTENAKKDGVRQTKTGLQYLVLKEGTGDTPATDHKVAAHYRGTFLNGKVFDESYEGDVPTDDESPREFPVTGVIAGWTEALQLMKVGSKYRLFITPELAYGENGRPGIPGNSLLIFDLELVKTTPSAKTIPLRR